ncbi:MAG: GyrI-like domain-containing protein [Clostridiales bacterium]|jgi:hypothetical protein|nr:GyrI-like domain-containing protein [Clostridiales bacterium]
MDKYDWKKHEKAIYGATTAPQIISLPIQKFICIAGAGNPNSLQFRTDVESLYGVAYTIKMKFKDTPNYFDYAVYPLEGFWSLTDKGIDTQNVAAKLDKNELKYNLMIKQPNFVDKNLFDKAKGIALTAKKNPQIKNARFCQIEENTVAQVLHIGSYDNEPETFEKLEKHLNNTGYKRTNRIHKEIYLSDARRVASNELKTILRVGISKK